MPWQDWLAIFSAVIGVAGFIITIITLIRTGSIKKAIAKKENEVKTQVAYNRKRDGNYKKLVDLSKISIDKFSYDDFIIFRETVRYFDYCDTVFSTNALLVIKEALDFCNKIYTKNNISDSQKKTCIEHINKVKFTLEKENLI